jgi:hypothetical protein
MSPTSFRARLPKAERFAGATPPGRLAEPTAIREIDVESQPLAKKQWVLKNSLMTLDKFPFLDSNGVIRGDAAHPSD